MTSTIFNLALVSIAFVVTYFLSSYRYNNGLNIKECFDPSSNDRVDSVRILLTLFSSVLQLTIIYISINAIAKNKFIDIESNISLSIVTVSVLLLVDIVLTHILKIKGMFLKIDIIKLAQAKAYYILSMLLIFLVIVFVNKSSDLSEIIRVQNYLHGIIPGWNFVILFPLFLVWLSFYRDHRTLIEKEKDLTKLDIIQRNIMFTLKDISFTFLTIILFFGGDNLFSLWDSLGLNITLLKLVSLLNFTLKYFLIFFIMKLYNAFYSKRYIKEITLRGRGKTYVVLSYMLIVCFYKVLL